MIRLLTLLAVTFGVACSPHTVVGEEWRSLFNGKDLTGWTVKIRGYELGDNHGDTFRVEDGLLKVRFDQYEGRYRGRYGHLFFNEPLANYRLRIEYRFVGEQATGGPGWAFRNSGVMIHGQKPEAMTLDQKFPVSVEVQFLGQADKHTANLCTPGTNVVLDGKLHTEHVTRSTSPSFTGDEWVTVEVEVRGDAVRHYVNGELVLEYTKPQLDPKDPEAKALLDAGADKLLTGGTISLQAESHPVDFRRIELLVE